MTATPKLPPGIYFNLGAEDYHADPALGSTALKHAAIDVYDWQFDRLHGEEKEPTDALIFGSAWHARVLEGRQALQERFCIEFDKSTCAGALDTVADLRDWLSNYGQVGMSGKTKAALVAAVREIDPDQPIIDVLKGDWEARNAGKTPLPPKRWAQVEAAAAWAQQHPMLSAVMEDGTFSHGAPEVSVFYVDRDLPLKARFDRLLRHAIIDMKSFAPMFTGKMRTQVVKAVQRNRYDLQAADYLRAWRRAKELFAKGLVFGAEPYDGFLAECFDRDEPDWIWIFTKTKSAPQSAVVPWRAKNAMAAAADEIDATIDRIIALRERFGDDADWVPNEGGFELDDTALPSYFGQD